VAAFALGLRSPLDTVCLAFFVLCGLTRLARFNVTAASIPKDATGKSRYFEGFPIPTSLGLVSGMALCLSRGLVLDKVPGGILRVWGTASVAGAAKVAKKGAKVGVSGLAMGLGDWGLVHPVVFLFVAWGCLMVSRTVRVPKP
jgi:CDP-diacylglycerol---serine O-phosphatidyltransferase